MIYLVLFISVIFGALIDARMWGDKAQDKPWLVRYTDFIWLGNWNITMPWLWMLVSPGTFTFTFILKFFIASFGMSVFWDAVFVRMEGSEWVRPIRVWSALPWWGPDRVYNRCLSVEKRMLIIGFNTVSDMMAFNVLRVLVLVGSLLI